MNERQIQCFLTVAETESFTLAAEKLYLSPQAVSQQIANLEHELSTQLFIRNNKYVALTEDGIQFYEFYKVSQENYTRTLNNIRFTYLDMRSQFSIGYSEWIDPYGEIDKAIYSFRLKNTKTRFKAYQYSNDILYKELEENHLDVALLCYNQFLTPGEFGVSLFAKEDIRLYAPLDIKDDVPDKNCWGLPHIDAPYGLLQTEEWVEISKRMNQMLGQSPTNHIIMPNLQSVWACSQNMRCTVACDERFGYLHNTKTLRSYSLPYSSYLCCIWKKSNENPLIEEFVKHLKEVYNDDLSL